MYHKALINRTEIGLSHTPPYDRFNILQLNPVLRQDLRNILLYFDIKPPPL